MEPHMEPQGKPPLPKPLKVVLAAGVGLFALPFLMAVDVPTGVVLGLGVALVVVVLAAAFVMLRDGFGRRSPRKAKAKGAGSALKSSSASPNSLVSKEPLQKSPTPAATKAPIALLLFTFLALTAPLAAHAIDRQTSFFLLDQAADMVAAVEVQESSFSEAKVRVIEVFRAPVGHEPKPGDELTLKLSVRDIDGGRFLKGVALCFATRSRSGWSVVSGPYMGSVRTLEDFTKDGKLNFLRVYITSQQVRDAITLHPQLAPAMCGRLGGDALVKARTALGLSESDPLPHIPLTGQRFETHKMWLDSGNPLLAVSALVDAYEIADGLASKPGTLELRKLPFPERTALDEVAIRGIASPDWHVQSAALAVFERIGFEHCPLPPLMAMASAKYGEHLPIVRCEAQKFLGLKADLGNGVIALLVKNLLDDTLRDLENDWPALGFANVPKRSEVRAEAIQLLEPLLASDDWYDNEAAIRALMALDDVAALGRLHSQYAKEPPGELRDRMEARLARWSHGENVALTTLILSESAKAERPSANLMAAVKSLLWLVDVRSDEVVSPKRRPEIYDQLKTYATQRIAALGTNQAEHSDAIGEMILSRLGDAAAFDRLLRGFAGGATTVDGAFKPMKLSGDAEGCLILALQSYPHFAYQSQYDHMKVLRHHGYAAIAKATNEETTRALIETAAIVFQMTSYGSPLDKPDLGLGNYPIPTQDGARIPSATVEQVVFCWLLAGETADAADWSPRVKSMLEGKEGHSSRSRATTLIDVAYKLSRSSERLKALGIPDLANHKPGIPTDPELFAKWVEASTDQALLEWALDPSPKPQHWIRPSIPELQLMRRLVLRAQGKPAAMKGEGETKQKEPVANPGADIWLATQTTEALFNLSHEWRGFCPAILFDSQSRDALWKEWLTYIDQRLDAKPK